jgi:hypothetical protein
MVHSKTDPAQANDNPPDGYKTSHRMIELQIPPTRPDQPAKPVTLLTHYQSWCRLLESSLAQHSRAIVWHLSTKGVNILSPTPSYDRLCAMLAFSFPDILFRPVESLADVVRATKLWDVAFTPLFDGAGLRDNIRRQMQNVVAYLPLRSELAVAIDDEDAYALLHAYSAYRFGFRAVPIGTGSLADLLFSKRKKDQAPPLDCDATLTIEDLYISFPDQKGKELSNLAMRHEQWPHLKKANHRVFVTSDHDRSKWQSNQPFLSAESARGIDIRKLHKPHAGMFRIWESAGLTRGLRWADDRARGGYAPGFDWPPSGKRSAEENAHDHSSPGFLMMIAEHLVERAEKMIPTVQSVVDAVKGAVLATDALELLGARTPTLAIEALRLKHHFEVLAECQFSGVEYHFPLVGRLKEIQRDVRAISKWFGRQNRESAATNAEMTILTDLVRVFRGHGQFDEEQQCMRRVRHLHNGLWMRQRPGRWLMWLPLRYLELLLSSFSTFVLVVMTWLIVIGSLMTIAFSPYIADGKPVGNISFLCGIQGALISMFTSGKPEGFFAGCNFGDLAEQTSAFGLVASTAMIAGYLHLAVLVAHLYTTINRR